MHSLDETKVYIHDEMTYKHANISKRITEKKKNK